MVVGVNGVGKTTTIGKLAHQFKSAGSKVVLGASDTFLAAAVDQLIIWSERVGVPIVAKVWAQILPALLLTQFNLRNPKMQML